MMPTKIQWATDTINPIVGCSHAGSPACDHCYAEGMARRLATMPQTAERYAGVTDEHGHWTGITRFVESELEKPLKWKAPRRIFVGSMTDLFHESVPFEWIDWVFGMMACCPQHTFMVLTKRPARKLQYMTQDGVGRVGYVEGRAKRIMRERGTPIPVGKALRWPLPNVWLGVTAEDQQRADERIPILLQIPAAVRFVSIEPLLGPVNLYKYYAPCRYCEAEKPMMEMCVASDCPQAFNEHNASIDWVIVGGESSHNARPLHPSWARSLRDQCQAAGVPYFFKQWGSWYPFYDRDVDDPDWQNIPKESNTICRMNAAGGQGFHGDRVVYFRKSDKHAAGRLLDGREWSEVPHGL
jgi:protein gp37